METRDQWYKPNLLYNIHYRPPKKPEPPKMIVQTVQFNPSVCTCGEHGCQPQYRMEKRVLWTNKEACNDKQQSEIKERENKNEHRENKFQESITLIDRKTGSVVESKVTRSKEGISQERHIKRDESKQVGLKEEIDRKCCSKDGDATKQMRLKEETDQKCCFIKDDGNTFGATASFQEKMFGGVEVRSDYKANDADNEKESEEVQDVDNDDDEEEEEEEDENEEKKECGIRNEIGCSDSKANICNETEISNTNNIKENNSNGRSDRDSSEGRNNERVYEENILGNDSETVLSNDCKGDGKGSKENQIEKDHTTGDDEMDDSDNAGDVGMNSSDSAGDVGIDNRYSAGDDGMDDSDSAGDGAEYCSEDIILINDSDEISESCSLESEDGDSEDVEIASAFGIMTIYCNSELHSPRSFRGEDD